MEATAVVDNGFIHWPEIVGLHVVRKNLARPGATVPPGVLTYKGKIKLHGNNGGINITGSEGCYTVQAQSRNQFLTPTKDLDGFAKWTEANKDAFIHARKALKAAFPTTEKTVVFGEWCGEGIQKKVSLCRIGRKIFAVFSLMVDQGLISEPSVIAKFFPPQLPENMHIIPWMTSEECGEAIGLDFNKVDHLEAEVVKINSLIGRIDNSDPWVLETFKVDGPGEGVVWYPVSLQTEIGEIPIMQSEHFSELAFKAKGEKHAVVKQDKPAQIQPQIAAGVPEFVAMFVTEGRGEQGLSKVCENGEKPSKAHTAKFIQWMVDDVKKESGTELEASGLTWKQVEKEVSNAARKWFLAHV
eukprot:Phypoly_transcript_12529.p1 GENE.Phypoly_transcript_12529~~Phypoly_transcript_12529.p1  ORF type:complete len:363 (+),score=73.65 Phypoly_transcript_12529:22-1089(+)